MDRLLPPILAVLLLVPLAGLWALQGNQLILRRDMAMPWDIPLILGLVALVWARVHFLRRSAEIHTFRTPGHLITDGPFRFSRNPMYLGFALLLLAAAFLVNSWPGLLVPLVFVLVANVWYIPHEERILRDLFGAQYETYAGKVRRWV